MPNSGAPVSNGTSAAVDNTVNVGNLAIVVLQPEVTPAMVRRRMMRVVGVAIHTMPGVGRPRRYSPHKRKWHGLCQPGRSPLTEFDQTSQSGSRAKRDPLNERAKQERNEPARRERWLIRNDVGTAYRV